MTSREVDEIMARALCNAMKPTPSSGLDAYDNLKTWADADGGVYAAGAREEYESFPVLAAAIRAELDKAGYALVPNEPTAKMADAAEMAFERSYLTMSVFQSGIDAYLAMLAASQAEGE